MFLKKCGARARTNNHQPCRQPAMKNGRCRLHGGKLKGPTTSEGRERQRKASTKHGLYTKTAMEEKRWVRQLMSWRHDMRELEEQIINKPENDGVV